MSAGPCGPVEAVLRFRALDAGWISTHALSKLTDLSVGEVEAELAILVRDKKAIARVGSGVFYHRAPVSRDMEKKLLVLREAREYCLPELAPLFDSIEADLMLLAELGVR